MEATIRRTTAEAAGAEERLGYRFHERSCVIPRGRVSAAVALLIGSPMSRVIGNFYLGFNRPQTPTRLFTDTDEAEAWLRTFLPTT